MATKDVEEALEFVLSILEHTRRLAEGLKETVGQREYDFIVLKRHGTLIKYITKNSAYYISDMGLQQWCATALQWISSTPLTTALQALCDLAPS